MTVVDPRFFSPYQVDLAIVRNSLTVADGNLSSVLDVNGNVLFIIKNKNYSLHDRHLLLDPSEIPILTFQKRSNNIYVFVQHRTIHRRWQAFRGESTSAKDLIFSTKKSSVIQKVTELNVFLSDNKEEAVSDYKVVGDWTKRSCTVYSSDGSTILAQMHDNHDMDTCIDPEENTFGVTVSPNVDYVVVVAFMVILSEVNKDRKKKKKKGKKKGGGGSREITQENESSTDEDDDDDDDDDEDTEDSD